MNPVDSFNAIMGAYDAQRKQNAEFVQGQEEANARAAMLDYINRNSPQNVLTDIPAVMAPNPQYISKEDYEKQNPNAPGPLYNQLIGKPEGVVSYDQLPEVRRQKEIEVAPARQILREVYPDMPNPSTMGRNPSALGAYGTMQGQMAAQKHLEERRDAAYKKESEYFIAYYNHLLPAAVKNGNQGVIDAISAQAQKFNNPYLQDYGNWLGKNIKTQKSNEKLVQVDFSDKTSIAKAIATVPELKDILINAIPEDTEKFKSGMMGFLKLTTDSQGNTTLDTSQLKDKSSSSKPIIRKFEVSTPQGVAYEERALKDGGDPTNPEDWVTLASAKRPLTASGGRGLKGFIQSKFVPGGFFNREDGKTYIDIPNAKGIPERRALDTLTVQEQSRYWPAELKKAQQQGGAKAVTSYVAAETYKQEAEELAEIRNRLKANNPSLFSGVGSDIRKINSMSQFVKMNVKDDPDLAEFIKGTTLLADTLQAAVGSTQGGQWAFELAAKLLDPSLPDGAYQATINKHMRTLENRAKNYRDTGKKGSIGYTKQPPMVKTGVPKTRDQLIQMYMEKNKTATRQAIEKSPAFINDAKRFGL